MNARLSMPTPSNVRPVRAWRVPCGGCRTAGAVRRVPYGPGEAVRPGRKPYG
ncbi:hypothetical protein [Sinosporangium album]|uniref:hypothetical protein n=1 Tax=Sinosporangium album TaxID=504805 RepID=UPI0015A18518|nr:hypothetical protein [Sinosporangium album]